MSRVLKYFVVLIAATAPARAQELVVPTRLSLSDALRLAAERNPSLSAVRRGVDIAEAQRLDARLRPNPALSFDSQGYPLFASPRPPFIDNQELSIRIDQEIELAGRRRLRTEAATAGIASAEATVADARRRLDLDVRRAYFGVVLAKADLEVARAALGEIDTVIGLNRARYDQGEISGADLRRIQVERLKFVDDVFATELTLRNARSTLLALVNAPDLHATFDVVETLGATETSPAGATPTAPALLDLDALRARALRERPDLQAAQREIQRADSETRLQRARRTPNVTIGGGYDRNFGTNAVVFGVTVPLPLFNRNQGGFARAVAEQQQAADRAAATATAVALDVQQAINAVDVSRARVAYIEREYLAPSREARDIVLASYQVGAANLIDYLDAQRAFRDTRRTYNRALYDQRLSLFQLTAATGGRP